MAGMNERWISFRCQVRLVHGMAALSDGLAGGLAVCNRADRVLAAAEQCVRARTLRIASGTRGKPLQPEDLRSRTPPSSHAG